jgi:hypothetical protein
MSSCHSNRSVPNRSRKSRVSSSRVCCEWYPFLRAASSRAFARTLYDLAHRRSCCSWRDSWTIWRSAQSKSVWKEDTKRVNKMRRDPHVQHEKGEVTWRCDSMEGSWNEVHQTLWCDLCKLFKKLRELFHAEHHIRMGTRQQKDSRTTSKLKTRLRSLWTNSDGNFHHELEIHDCVITDVNVWYYLLSQVSHGCEVLFPIGSGHVPVSRFPGEGDCKTCEWSYSVLPGPKNLF